MLSKQFSDKQFKIYMHIFQHSFIIVLGKIVQTNVNIVINCLRMVSKQFSDKQFKNIYIQFNIVLKQSRKNSSNKCEYCYKLFKNAFKIIFRQIVPKYIYTYFNIIWKQLGKNFKQIPNSLNQFSFVNYIVINCSRML